MVFAQKLISLYFTQEKMNQMRLLDSNVCWHRWQDSRAHCHMVWRCPTIKELWDSVTLSLSIFLNHTAT